MNWRYRFRHNVFSMPYAVDNGGKLNFFTCSRHRFSLAFGVHPTERDQVYYVDPLPGSGSALDAVPFISGDQRWLPRGNVRVGKSRTT
jgi:hypothetical protein